MSRTANVIRLAIAYTALLLARFGIIDAERGKQTAELAWPRIVTGLAQQSKTAIDLAMVGLAVGPAAIAGMGFGFAYWVIALSIGFGLADGSMTFLSQRYGADDRDSLDIAIKQTVWIALVIAGGLTIGFFVFAETLIAVLGAEPDALEHGTVYLRVIVIALVFEMVANIAERTLLSANDAWSPMVVRVLGGIGNIILSAIFIFGFDWGVFGAALGTVVATAAIAITFTIGMIVGRLPWIGTLPVRVRVGPPYVDIRLTKRILVVSTPLMGKQLISFASTFAMLAIVATFGTIVVAAYTVAREVRGMMNTPGWGFGIAARSLVGQQLGIGDEREAAAYGRDILRFATAVYVAMSLLMFVFAEQIVQFFTTDGLVIAAAVPFILAMAVSLPGNAVDGAASGIIGAAGDTRWELYARLIGIYVFMIPIAFLGLITPLGILALYLAIIAETMVPALITFYRFKTGKWKIISRRYRPSIGD